MICVVLTEVGSTDFPTKSTKMVDGPLLLPLGILPELSLMPVNKNDPFAKCKLLPTFQSVGGLIMPCLLWQRQKSLQKQ